jgi:hypothetical protein
MSERLLIVVCPGRGYAGPLDGRRYAGAVFERVGKSWRCVRAAPVLDWMEKTPMKNIETWLKGPAAKKGWRYHWAKKWDI